MNEAMIKYYEGQLAQAKEREAYWNNEVRVNFNALINAKEEFYQSQSEKRKAERSEKMQKIIRALNEMPAKNCIQLDDGLNSLLYHVPINLLDAVRQAIYKTGLTSKDFRVAFRGPRFDIAKAFTRKEHADAFSLYVL